MWLILAFMSAALLGCYDSFKKAALRDNAVIPVLFLNTVFCSLLFLPLIVLSAHTQLLDGSIFHVASGGWEVHRYVVLKSLIVLSSWIFGYIGMMLGIGLTQLLSAALGDVIPIFNNPTVQFGAVMGCNALMILAGVVAGYIPARRAISIKLVDALAS